MLARVLTVALNAYREAVRARVLLGLAAVAFAVALYSLVVGAFALREAPRVVSDLGSMGISVFSIVMAIAISATTLHRELEQKTIFPILARPLRRSEYLVGKYGGTMLVIGVFVVADTGVVLLMGAALAGRSVALVLSVGLGLTGLLAVGALRSPRIATFGPIPWAALLLLSGVVLSGVAPGERSLVLGSSVLCFLEIGIIAALATLFSSFSTPFLATFFTVCCFIVGRSADSLRRLPVKVFGQALHDAGAALSKMVPNLQIYVPARPLLTGEAVEAHLPSYLGLATLQSVAWTVGLLVCAALIFRRRDFL